MTSPSPLVLITPQNLEVLTAYLVKTKDGTYHTAFWTSSRFIPIAKQEPIINFNDVENYWELP